ncbi:hypothetical protein FOCC_FOCC006547 [Frankliniella occidentalis]|uniref:palmitoyl-CoA hydrolase n=2 Tax=Frankliniella occidentalis TaxID=133901 RepID=A0A6J1S1E9_FRAOC|nr:lysosomal thioesterase PPT2 homolog isoform X1 [Frankliniella occidentalis]XP_026272641.1 lysosomal thioesterase PPT2 homolog isoform X1 [Frankliniella occidentalis]XP_026272642.1 lysosomal thioesterase PPT2 homolog isoform X1 [Frankliniella occidentalis]KAE8746799.1 hypothetical protein FOCC_FOCC006547 [Frankliniella occidentalis]
MTRLKTFVGNTIFLLTFLSWAHCYKPVVLIHGVMTGKLSMLPIAERIAQLHPGTSIYITDRFSGWSSLEPMWHQVEEMGADLLAISADHPEGIHLIGYSQGGLLSRAILERYPEHNVHTFISLSSPQFGQYGTKFLHLFFPDLTCHTAYELFYSYVGQHTSVGNYWNDPHHQELFFKYSQFLPYVNNQFLSNSSESYKSGFTKLKKLILVGGPDDGVITPWQSSQFGYYDEKEEVYDMRQNPLYKNDSFGLRTLDEAGKVTLLSFSGMDHFDWHINISFIDQHIVPLLD